MIGSMKSAEIRETFLKFFENYHHQRVKSSSLIPAGDPTLMFANAGMNQFKDVFLGLSDLGFKRATTCQKCVRAGGKHNDLENVGFTARHHTFFEMLGNFSFGDYFKKDAINYAWELVTRYYKIPTDKLRVTVFETDDEAFDLWKRVGVREDWIYRLGEKDNFWAMGDTGPCGPCSEIYYDWGPKYGCGKPDCNPGCACGARFLEIWNLVFMQFNRDTSGKMNPLPKPSVDTGAGLERIAAVLQGQYNNYDTDCFAPIIQSIEKVTGVKYHSSTDADTSMRVIADHMRSGTFLLADGAVPSNEGRGYVLRRILRRAIRHGKKLGQQKPFLYEIVASVCGAYGAIYPELNQNRKIIEVMLREEEERFHETLHRGMGLLEETIQGVKAKKGQVIPGDVAFKLYDTFGFPFDLIQVIGAEQNLTVDEKHFDELMEKQRSSSTFNRGGDAVLKENITKALESHKWETQFLGYEKEAHEGALLMLLSDKGQEIKQLGAKETGYAIFDQTPFYAESGGQVGDKGVISKGDAVAHVVTTSKFGKTILHRIEVEKGTLKSGENYALDIEAKLRRRTAINHTATHMLHAALRTVLGDRVKQAGSLVDPDRLRFDFTYPRAMTAEEITKVENILNAEVAADDPVTVKEMSYDEAMKTGALAFFDEKYGDRVRVVKIAGKADPFSVELCGGTHLSRTSEVGFFKVTSESSVASGVRRIEAITSTTAYQFLEQRSEWYHKVENLMAAKGDQAFQKLQQLVTANKNLQKEIEQLKLKVAQGGGPGKSEGAGGALHDKAVPVEGTDLKLVAEKVPGVGPKILRTLVDQVRDKLKEKTVVALVGDENGKVALCVGLTKDLVGRFDSGKLIQPMAKLVGGTGGGRPDFAQAGGTSLEGIDAALASLKDALKG